MNPSGSDKPLSSVDETRQAIAHLTWDNSDRTERFGIEVEAIPVQIRNGEIAGRLPLTGAGGVMDLAEGVSDVPPGGRITFEPGGQIEYSSAPHEDAGSVLMEVEQVWDQLSSAFGRNGVALPSLGLDPWHPVETVPQQLEAPRYRAMERYFGRDWPAGAVMMRNTASLQVSLEAGIGETRRERWLAANLLAPVMIAIFTTSPSSSGIGSLRAKTWLEIDRTRTGVPLWPSAAMADPVADVEDRVLGARVIFAMRDGEAVGMPSGTTFLDWLTTTPNSVGKPTVSDLATHMSTIFTEVRPRNGTLELRTSDAMPRRWWSVPLTFAGALLYNEVARRQVIETLSGTACRLDQTLMIAAETGLRSPLLARPAEKLVRLAAETARCDDRFPSWMVERLEEFIDRFTFRGRAPADEIRPLLDDPAALLAWAEA